MDFARRVLARMPRFDFCAWLGRLDVGGKEAGVEPFQNRAYCPYRSDIWSCQHQMSAGAKDAIHLAHHPHGIGREMLQQLAAEHSRKMAVRIREDIFLGVKEV